MSDDLIIPVMLLPTAECPGHIDDSSLYPASLDSGPRSGTRHGTWWRR